MTTTTVHRGEVFRLNGKKVIADGTYERYAWVKRTDGSRTAVKVESLLPYVSPTEKAAARKARLADITRTIARLGPRTATTFLCTELHVHEKTARSYLKAAGLEWYGRAEGWKPIEQAQA
jgi:hypothetical protein